MSHGAFLFLLVVPALFGEGWDRLRGPNGSGVADGHSLPAEIGAQA